MSEIKNHVMAAAEVTGTKLSGAAIAIMAKKLERYGEPAAVRAIGKAMERVEYKLTLASIVKHMGICADEAWAHVPKSEHENAYVSGRMMLAYGVAKPLIDAGDMIAARRAFISAYDAAEEDGRWWHTEACGMGYEEKNGARAAAYTTVTARGWIASTPEQASKDGIPFVSPPYPWPDRLPLASLLGHRTERHGKMRTQASTE